VQVNSGNIPPGMTAEQVQNDVVTNIQAGTYVFFTKFGYVDYDPSRLKEAGGCYKGCRYDKSDGTYYAIVPAYVGLTERINRELWGVSPC
jgi:hypothetical protein